MRHSISDIARALGCEALGDTALTIAGVAEPADAGPDDLALAMKPAFAQGLAQGHARAALMWHDADWESYGLSAAILVPRPRVALSHLTAMFDQGPGYGTGIHPTAIIGEEADIGPGVTIAPYATISRGAQIGAGSVIGPHVHIGPDAQIGEGALLHARVFIGPRVRIGARFIGHPGAVIGSDGFSFVTPEKGAVENVRETLGEAGQAPTQSWTRIHSLGAVVIGDDVEIGANTCVDAGTIRPTQIGNGTKIDNFCHIAHNVTVGRDCLFAAYAGIAGSTSIGNNVVFGGKVGVADNITVGDGVIAGAATKILSNAPAGRVLMGYPAVKMANHIESYKALRRLPRLFDEVARLKKAVFKPGEND